QDNEISWIDWEHADRELLAFTASLIALRHTHPIFRRRDYFLGRPIYGAGITDIGWYRPDGELMSENDWNCGHNRAIGVFLNGDPLNSLDPGGDPTRDDSFSIAFNGHYEDIVFPLPQGLHRHFSVVLNTNEARPARMKPTPPIHSLLPHLKGSSTRLETDSDEAGELRSGETIAVVARSLIVWRSNRTAQEHFR